MDIMTKFTIFHISDLHFSEGTDLSNPAHTHSVRRLTGLQRALNAFKEKDFLIVSGDISNLGDRQSLINASGFIFDTIPIGKGKMIGLNASIEKCGIVPGNHDAWNSPSLYEGRTLLDRRQKALENYNFAFKDHQIDPEYGSYYRWLEKDGHGLYMAFVDSCFLGDTEDNKDSTFGNIRYDQAIAKGKLTVDQTERLLELHDLGMKGRLPKSTNNDAFIEKDIFAQSLKILIMHHYIFEPPGHSSDYFMRISHRDIVFRNIAMSDFDILLCGHKHIPAFDIHSYGAHFDGRAMNRYVINCFRRFIGLHSLPLQFEVYKGRYISKALTFVTSILHKMTKRNKPNADSKEIADDVLELLKDGLDNPDGLEKKIKTFINEKGVLGAEILNKGELKDIKKRISIGLSVEERKKLKDVSNKIMKIAKKLKSKTFIQAMSGASVKKAGGEERIRSFNKYDIFRTNDSWELNESRYEWDYSSDSFSLEDPFEVHHTFKKRNVFSRENTGRK